MTDDPKERREALQNARTILRNDLLKRYPLPTEAEVADATKVILMELSTLLDERLARALGVA